ncbi:hypothetical protein PAXRUDRAFT_348345 [Paxillus rubicundulus Ve08.2h10]|uniref:Uncharacterized protein n=1 Tax=Paxillus rubicundulus Ve08.2h10 TaxID=930991 RepID=A0A0D0E9N8_9AGAM|nr:hypothetical protein PAXRUDRAFT_348345 [Paxillus rubicundulus Ve08.2h10]
MLKLLDISLPISTTRPSITHSQYLSGALSIPFLMATWRGEEQKGPILVSRISLEKGPEKRPICSSPTMYSSITE